MKKLHILTVQDFLWLNQELTGSQQEFSYALLEEAVYCQYAYGASHQVIEQAASLLTGFARLRPFERGSQACAFAGMVGFLELNGWELNLSPETAAEWVRAHLKAPAGCAESLRSMVKEDSDAHHDEGSARIALGRALRIYASSLDDLVENEPVRPLQIK